MAKILGNKEYSDLKQKSDALDTIVQSILKSNPGLTAEEITPEFVNNIVSENSDNQSSDIISENETLKSENETLKSENETLKSENEILKSENETLKSDNEELVGLPATVSVSGKKGKIEESSFKGNELLEFANSGKTTAEIAQKAIETGFYNPKRLK